MAGRPGWGACGDQHVLWLGDDGGCSWLPGARPQEAQTPGAQAASESSSDVCLVCRHWSLGSDGEKWSMQDGQHGRSFWE